MAKLPDEVKQAWDKRDGPVVLATVDGAGTPNIIYASCVGRYGDDCLVVADNYFDKTRANLKAGTPGSLLFMSPDGAFQVKGSLSYETEGAIYDDMKTWNPEKHPGHAAAALHVEAVFAGAKRLV